MMGPGEVRPVAGVNHSTPMAGRSRGNCVLPVGLVASMSVVHTLQALEDT